jgi:hypothetical protein
MSLDAFACMFRHWEEVCCVNGAVWGHFHECSDKEIMFKIFHYMFSLGTPNLLLLNIWQCSQTFTIGFIQQYITCESP